LFKSPEVWKTKLANGIDVFGIENNEVPLVSFVITIDGGHYLDPKDKAGKLFFIDFPGAKQSVIYAGKLALSQVDPMYNNLEYTNQILGGESSGRLFQTLRIEKGHTYGAYSFLQKLTEQASFVL